MHVAILHNLDHDLLEDDPGREARKDVAKVAEALASELDQGTMRAQVLPVSGAADLLANLERTRPDL
ncbi:MAG TPA: D-alanine--D-alanine ligase, partial [Myxococcales bacterium]|nr:D-alanine--D-alanine ligase [Myxococcales bacterium]